jgi:hypothetical protein
MGCGLRKETETMLSMIPGAWKVKCYRYGAADFICGIVDDGDWSTGREPVSGRGRTKAEAYRSLLENWRSGKWNGSFVQAPAGSTEELRLKLAIRGNDDGGTRS